jgi:hypothetical protein
MGFTVLADKIPEVIASKHVVISRIANKANLSDNTSIMESLASTEYIKAFIPETQGETMLVDGHCL